jgi:hypothetical protein
MILVIPEGTSKVGTGVGTGSPFSVCSGIVIAKVCFNWGLLVGAGEGRTEVVGVGLGAGVSVGLDVRCCSGASEFVGAGVLVSGTFNGVAVAINEGLIATADAI